MENLVSFVTFLNDHSLFDIKKIINAEFDFDTRLMLQKYTYFAGKLGLEHGYEYSLYHYGPHSPGLADDYYELSDNPSKLKNMCGQQMVGSFDQERFVQLVKGKSVEWLEIASTLVDQKPRFDSDESLVSFVENIKPNYTKNYIQSVLNDLKKQGIITHLRS